MVNLVIGETMQASMDDDMNWTVAGAKAKLSEVMERAQLAPQTITRNGRPSVVVVSAEEWQKKTARRGSLAEFLLASPLRGADLDLERQNDEPRDLSL
jgi:prevent-host-death family protein